MRMRRLLLVVGLVLSVSACGGTDESESPSGGETRSDDSTTSTTARSGAVTTTSAKPTTTSAIPTPTTLPPPKAISGSGTQVVDLGAMYADPYLAIVTHDGGGDFNFQLKDSAGDASQFPIATGIEGNYLGVVPVNFKTSEGFQFVDVQADGPWAITFAVLSSAPAANTAAGATYTGNGDQVIQFQTTTARTVRVTCGDCESNFQVTSWGADEDLLVNDIGPFDGTALVPAQTVLLSISTRGNIGTTSPTWTVTPT